MLLEIKAQKDNNHAGAEGRQRKGARRAGRRTDPSQGTVRGERLLEEGNVRRSTSEGELDFMSLARFRLERDRVGKSAKNGHGRVDGKGLHDCFVRRERSAAWA